jgi:hypothetical protein
VKRLIARLAMLGAVLLAVSSCVGTDAGGYTVSGTVTLNGVYGQSPATVTAKYGSLTYTMQVTFSTDGNGNSSFTYTLNHVPAGTYDVIAEITTTWSPTGFYGIDGAPVTTPISMSSISGGVAATVSGVSVQADTTVDVQLNYST